MNKRDVMGKTPIAWKISDDLMSIMVSIDGGNWFYPKKSFFTSPHCPKRLKEDYREICNDKYERKKMEASK